MGLEANGLVEVANIDPNLLTLCAPCFDMMFRIVHRLRRGWLNAVECCCDIDEERFVENPNVAGRLSQS